MHAYTHTAPCIVRSQEEQAGGEGPDEDTSWRTRTTTSTITPLTAAVFCLLLPVSMQPRIFQSCCSEFFIFTAFQIHIHTT